MSPVISHVKVFSSVRSRWISFDCSAYPDPYGKTMFCDTFTGI